MTHDEVGALGAPGEPGDEQPAASPPTVSGMFEVGKLVSACGAVVAGITGLFVGVGDNESGAWHGALVALYLAGGVLSLGAFMVMIGALEQRLIEIRELLRQRPVEPVE
ncbi:MAG TPA: hypothetical protein VHW60_09215 [Caulobacteraceae bacterium]|jgi:uncharacterized protein YaaQ|nr:hypothetical protein [Caulobacteraceae bacterium]